MYLGFGVKSIFYPKFDLDPEFVYIKSGETRNFLGNFSRHPQLVNYIIFGLFLFSLLCQL